MRAKAIRPVGNVIPLRAQTETTEDIVAAVEGRSRQQGEHIYKMLQELCEGLDQRHHQRVQQLQPIGHAMTAQQLKDWTEIGQRMLGKGSRK